MLPRMSAYDIDDVDRILATKRSELTDDTLRGVPSSIRELRPHVFLAPNGDGVDRWLAFGRPPFVEWLQLAPLSAIAVIDQYRDSDRA